MNYEKFNDAMCKLRQAEENLNKALQDAYSAIDKAYLKDSSTELQAKIDEAYNKGTKDLYEAFRIIAAEDGMSTSDLKDAFDICSVCNIILGFTPEEIIDKTLEWKTKQKKEEQELHVGDEIICAYDCSMDYNKTFIYLGRTEYYMKMFDLDKMRAESTNNFVHYRKTGKHYDAIPFPKEIK